MASATRLASRANSTICSGWASMPSGSRRSFRHRWPTSATTSPTIRGFTRCLVLWPTSILLLAEAHRRHLKVILDYVPNHTSDQHPWFLESRAHRDTPEAGLVHLVRPGTDGGPPNNWRSVFGGRAWEWESTTGQYYYHAYLKEQPDLNWRHPEVQAAMLDAYASGSTGRGWLPEWMSSGS